MFGAYPGLAHLPSAKIDPKDIPPPTPVTLPHSHPQLREPPSAAAAPTRPLIHLLQSIHRPAGLDATVFQALGVHVIPDVPAVELLPDPAYLPDFAAWHKLSVDEARERNSETRRPLNTGALSPGCQTYLDRKRELSYSNEDAFRTVRRIPAPKGTQQPRLGNSYEFFRCLETLTTFWDDPSQPPPAPPPDGETSEDDPKAERRISRTAAGSNMPGDYRQSLLNAFLKLIAYDFGCNVSAPRTEPRLYITTPPEQPPIPRSSHFSSGCTFIFRTPTTREAARAGLVDGPLAAVSVRASTSFATPAEHAVDLARELVAALLTAQHRAREGRTEKRFGEGAWWTTRPRWGGGSGGPIGREAEKDGIPGDKDAAAPDADGVVMPLAKKPRKNLGMYDNYRMVRPPSASWDRKTRYEAIGRDRGAGHDDIFVVSSLFHHVSILRVRVPDALLQVLEGGADEPGTRSWGGLEVRRSRWFDLFVVEERIEAMQLVWGMMVWLMRQPAEAGDGDVKMAGA